MWGRKHRRSLRLLTALFAVASVWLTASVGAVEPITGDRYHLSIQLQGVPLQNHLRILLAAHDEMSVLGPLDPQLRNTENFGYDEVRVLCTDLDAAKRAVESIKADDSLTVRRVYWFHDEVAKQAPHGFRGAVVLFDHEPSVVVTTINQMRFLVWAKGTVMSQRLDADRKALLEYAVAVSDYLFALDKGFYEAAPPVATEYGLPEEIDFYAPPPDYVIEGYQNYKDYLNAYADLHTDYATGILSFIPGDSLLEAIKAGAPEALFPNKEEPMFQEEYRTFLERGGDVRALQTLTRKGFDTLQAGEYFFAVGANGTVRFGRELLREDVDRIERESGRKVPRANHAFLFPGEAILTAGAFFIEQDSLPHLVGVNAQSGHYFYSNVSSTILEDIADRSDFYLSTLGHFFVALDSLGIEYDQVLISKL